MANIHDFVKDLKISRAFTSKQTIVIENLLIYISNLKIYKVVISINPNQLKKAQKLGFSSQYHTIFLASAFDDVPIKIENVKNVDKGKFIVIYDLNLNKFSIFPGEESEEAQYQRIKNTKRCIL